LDAANKEQIFGLERKAAKLQTMTICIPFLLVIYFIKHSDYGFSRNDVVVL
jgi:hypothetical protein